VNHDRVENVRSKSRVGEPLLVRVLSVAEDLMSLLRGGREVGERVGERSKDEDLESDGDEEGRSCEKEKEESVGQRQEKKEKGFFATNLMRWRPATIVVEE